MEPGVLDDAIDRLRAPLTDAPDDESLAGWDEPRWLRVGWLIVALAVTFCFWFMVRSYWAPAHPGVDQNGYQFGGRTFAETLTTGFKPANDYAYVGWMYVRTESGMYFPKYPLGIPVLDALCLWVGGEKHGVEWVYLVSPVCATLSILGMFLLVRTLAGSFAAVLGMILLATSPVTFELANDSNSHAPALAFSLFGMLVLIRWLQHGKWWRGAAAGLLMGIALTIRYTEGLLLLPMFAAILCRMKWKQRKSWMEALSLVLGWAIPVVALLIFNRVELGTWTGYASTNESTGFSWKNFADKWQYMVDQLHSRGLFFVVPLGVLGLGLMFRKNWKIALLINLWFWPGVLVYASYYWGLQWPGMAYLRFFLTLFPPLIFGAAWLFDYGARVTDGVRLGRFHGRIAGPIAAGVIVSIAVAMNVFENYGAMERDFAINQNLADTGNRIRTRLPDEPDPARRALLFGNSRQLLNYIQFAGRYECYEPDAFTSAFWMRRKSNGDPDAPTPLQPARLDYMRSFYEGKSDQDLIKEAQKIMSSALNANRRVFVVMPSGDLPRFKGRFIGKEFDVVTIERWKEPVNMSDEGKKSLTKLGMMAMWFGSGVPRYWEILEVVRKRA